LPIVVAPVIAACPPTPLQRAAAATDQWRQLRASPIAAGWNL